MYNDTREDLKHVESELEKDKEAQEKWKNEQNGNDEKHYGIGMDNVPSESIPDTTMKLENSNTVIANHDKTESVTVVKILTKMKKMKSSKKAKEEKQKQKQKERKKRTSMLFDKKKINLTALLAPHAEKERKGRKIHDFFKQESGQDDGGNSAAGANSGGLCKRVSDMNEFDLVSDQHVECWIFLSDQVIQTITRICMVVQLVYFHQDIDMLIHNVLQVKWVI